MLLYFNFLKKYIKVYYSKRMLVNGGILPVDNQRYVLILRQGCSSCHFLVFKTRFMRKIHVCTLM